MGWQVILEALVLNAFAVAQRKARILGSQVIGDHSHSAIPSHHIPLPEAALVRSSIFHFYLTDDNCNGYICY